MAASRTVQFKNWCFTYNNYPDARAFIDELRAHPWVKHYVVQQELAPDTGTPHLQGYVALKSRRTITVIKGDSGAFPTHGTIHWEPCREIEASIRYCSDARTRDPDGELFSTLPNVPSADTTGAVPVVHRYTAEQLLCIKRDEFFTWQESLFLRLQGVADDRTVHWYWERVGRTGKTAFSKFMVHHHRALYIMGKTADILHGVVSFDEKYKVHPSIIIFDIPRCQSGFINYQAIEVLKNGMGFSGKYESAGLLFPPPHMVIFANEPPDETKLSADRWHIVEIETGTLDTYPLAPTEPAEEGAGATVHYAADDWISDIFD